MRLGKKLTKEHKRKISLATKGGNRTSFKKGFTPWNKGRKTGIKTKGTTGLKHTKRWRIENSKRQRGSKSHFWKGGISTYERKLYLNGRRRANKRSARGTHTQEEWEELKTKYNNKCVRCNLKFKRLTQDHIIPLSKRGSDYIENIQPLCQRCNSIKNNKIINYLKQCWINPILLAPGVAGKQR